MRNEENGRKQGEMEKGYYRQAFEFAFGQK